MKKALILTSVIALTACSTGGGEYNPGHTHGSAGHSTVSTPVFVPVPSANESLTVDPENANITGMASSTITNEAAVRASMVSYVLGKMPGIYTNDNLTAMLPRGASNRNLRDGDELTDEQKFFIANKKLTAMKATLNAMASADDLEAYIDAHQASVAEALLLFGQDIDLQDIDPTVLLADFNAIVEGTDIATAIETFEAAQSFVYDTAMLDTVRFQDAGDANAYFKFHLDGDEIDKVAVFEGNEVNDYGWFTKTDNSNGKEFGKTLYGYRFTLDSLPTEGEFTEAQLATFAWFNTITGKDDIINLRFRNGSGTLTNDQIKNEMLNTLEKEFEDFIGGQHGGLPELVNPDLAYQQYVQMINAAFSALGPDEVVFGQTITPLTLTVTMQGIGKDLGLKYSDLGYADLKDVHEDAEGTLVEEHTYSPYAGGYADRVVDPGNTSATYTGTAIAGVEWKTQTANGDKSGNGMLVRNDNAQLSYDGSTGISTLIMNNLRNDAGEKWYNVTVSGDFNGEHASDLTFTFDATGKTTDAAYDFITNPATVAFTDTEWNNHDGRFKHTVLDADGNPTDVDYRGNAGVDYYGPMGTPTEVGATFGFSEEQHTNDGHGNEDHHEVAIYGAFGGTN